MLFMAWAIWMLKDILEKTDFFFFYCVCVCLPHVLAEIWAGMCLILLRLQELSVSKEN